MKYGLTGQGIGYTFSPEIHALLGLSGYEVFDTDDIKEFVAKRDFDFVNVTQPYKRAAFELADFIDDSASAVGAANLLVNNGGKLTAYNTDVYGLKAAISKRFDSLKGMTVLLLGTGGASRAARVACRDLGADKIITVSHSGSGDVSYECVADIATSVDIIINCTPVGTTPYGLLGLITASDFTNCKGYFDLVYNPLRTKTVQDFSDLGVYTQNGLYMLVAQAAYTQELALKNGACNKINNVFITVANSKRNIVLTGMPGCGKSTVGSMLAKGLGREFADTDELFFEAYGITPSECIKRFGENDFRKKEKLIVESVSSRQGIVIATGGGAIIDKQNYMLLRQNGVICYLHREPSDLAPLPNRPLADSKQKLMKLYAQRIDVYKSHCDLIITQTDYREAADTILKKAFIV